MIKKNEKFLSLFVLFMIYKVSIETAYWQVIGPNNLNYVLDFNPLKYINGLINLSLIYFLIILKRQKTSSTFFLLFEYAIALIPMTVIFALANESSVYYNLLSLAFVICVIVTKFIKKGYILHRPSINKITLSILLFLTFVMFINVLYKNGIPSLDAINIYNVYNIRSAALFSISKYYGYLLRIIMYSILPFFLAVNLYNRKYGRAIFVISLIMFFYLHQPHKTYLFSIPLIIVTDYLIKYGYKSVFKYYNLAIISIIALSFKLEFFTYVQSLIIRRVLITSAYLRYNYYDFFIKNPLIGFSGTIIGKLLNSTTEYGSDLGRIISEVYYNAGSNANTSFLVEGFIRFGYIGIFLSLIVFTFVLRQIDVFESKVGSKLAITIWIMPIYMLNESFLISELLFGFILTHIIISFYYKNQSTNLVTKV